MFELRSSDKDLHMAKIKRNLINFMHSVSLMSGREDINHIALEFKFSFSFYEASIELLLLILCDKAYYQGLYFN